MGKNLAATDINLLSDYAQLVTGKVRYRQKEQACRFTVKNDIMEVEFCEAVDAITPGQSVVLYNQDTVVGGGIIERNTMERRS
jgi:tRNA-specific 2-thiouridylase